MPHRLALMLATVLVSMLALTGTASAHTSYCGHGDHYYGHSSYLVQFVRHFDSAYYGHVHTVKVSTGRTWYGSYKTLVGYRTVRC